jgi:hypothetical protein
MALAWPLPALLTWCLAWGLYTLLAAHAAAWVALLAACALGTLASFMSARWWRRGLIALGFPLSLALSGVATFPAWAWLLPLGLLLAVYPLHAWRDAPLFPTPQGALSALAQQVPLPEGARVLDAGCGLGDGLRALREAYPLARLEGIEGSAMLRWLCALRCPWARVRKGDIWRADWSGYQLIYLFQRPESMPFAEAKARAEMPTGAWLVSLEFALPDAAPTVQWRAPDGRPLWAYRLPLGPERQDATN